MNDGLHIRSYQAADWPAICRIHDVARVQELAAGNVDPRAFRTMIDAAEGDEFFVSKTLVACIDDAVAGFVAWNGPYITWLYVDPNLQRRGIGSRLLNEALQQCGLHAWTSMIAGNDAALSLYKKAGFEIVSTKTGEIEGYHCLGHRLALPTSCMHDPQARRSDRPS